jgi:hypothetical protein
MAQRSLKFVISADNREAISALDKLGLALEQTKTKTGASSDGMVKFEGAADKLAKKLGVETSGQLNTTSDRLQQLVDHMQKTNAPAADIERATNKLHEAQTKYNESLKTTAEKSSFWDQWGGKITASVAAIGGAIVAFGASSVKAFSDAEIVNKQLEAALKSTGGAAGVTKEQIDEMATSLSNMSGIDDEVIKGGQAMLLTFTNIGKDIFPAATTAMTDMATAMNGGVLPGVEQLRTTSIQLGKALNDPIAGLTALKKVGVSFTEEQRNSIKAMVEHGQVAQAQQAILAELSREFGGSAKAAGETFAGGIAKLNVEFGNLQEDIGGKVTPALTGLMQTFPTLSMGFVGVGKAIGGLNISAGELMIALPLMKNMFTSMPAMLGNVAKGLGAVAVAAAAAYAIVDLYKSMREKGVALDEQKAKLTQLASTMDKDLRPAAIEIIKQMNAQKISVEEATKRIAAMTPVVKADNEARMQTNAELKKQNVELDKQAKLIETVRFHGWQKLHGDIVEINKEMANFTNTLQLSSASLDEFDKDASARFKAVWDETMGSVAMTSGTTFDQIETDWSTTKDEMNKTTGAFGEFWKNQVSTVVTGFSQGVADLIFSGKSLKDTMVGIFKEMGESVVRMFVEFGINKLIGRILGTAEGGGGTNSITGAFDSVLGSLKTKMKEWGVEIEKIISAIGGGVGVITGMNVPGAPGAIQSGASGALTGISIATMLSESAWAGPIGLAIGATVGLVAWLFGQQARNNKNKVDDTVITEKGFKQIWDIYSAYQSAGGLDPNAENALRKDTLVTGIGLWNEMAKTYKRPESLKTQRDGILGFIEAVNSVYQGKWDASLKAFPDFPNVTHDLSLPVQPMARGGIVTRPTMALIGEAGPEAVIPLGRGGMGAGNVYITVERVETNDPRKLVDGLIDLAKMNRGGTRVRLREALAI